MYNFDIEIIEKLKEKLFDEDCGCVALFEQHRLNDINLVYELYRGTQKGFIWLIKIMSNYIERKGEQIFKR